MSEADKENIVGLIDEKYPDVDLLQAISTSDKYSMEFVSYAQARRESERQEQIRKHFPTKVVIKNPSFGPDAGENP